MKNVRIPFFRQSTPVVAIILLVSAVSAAMAQDKSVNPGINKTFENPEVGEFVERFETEGRDAFDHRHEIVAACQLQPGMTVADIGAGTGLFTRLFAKSVGPEGRVYAVDIAENFVKHIEQTAQAEDLKNITGVVCGPDAVNLPDGSIDVAFICDTYHHFEFPGKTMRSLHRALKPGGQVVLVDFHRIEGVSRDWILSHVRAGQEVFTGEIVECGFRQIEEHPDLLEESYLVRFEKLPADAR
ncbi:MAG: methyltransferase domain-containing protein [Planctomycetaceae bacterium]|nr:methyltransferase domain-containing protein [Planctomycetaceae bacterium]